MKFLLLTLTMVFSLSTAQAKEKQKLTAEEKAEVLKVLELNEKLHFAFFKYDEQKAQIPTLASEVKTAIDGISNEELKNKLKFSQEKLTEISADASKDDNNQNYHLVSMALIHIINSYDVGDDYSPYTCPMVKKKWIQNSKKMAKVHNPYASDMPHCGEKYDK